MSSIRPLTQLISCTSCENTFRDPRILTCGHTFCCSCLSSSNPLQVTCPQCGTITSSSNGPTCLPKNEFLNQLTDGLRSVGIELTVSPKKLQCEECKAQDSERYCETCDANWCAECLEKSHSFTLFASHRITAPRDKKRNPKCPDHEGEPLKYWCVGCKKLSCRDCLLFDHKDHDYQDLKNAGKTEKTTISQDLNKIKQHRGLVEASMSELEQKKLFQEQHLNEMKTKFQLLVQKIHQELTTQHNQQLKELEEKTQKCLNTLQKMELTESFGTHLLTESVSEVLPCVTQMRSVFDFSEELKQIPKHQSTKYMLSDLLTKEVEKKLRLSKFNSTILDDVKLEVLESMFPTPELFGSFKLLSSSSDFQTETFETIVTGKGQTLFIIKTMNNFIFGAYVHDVWDSEQDWIPGSQETFLFTFGNGAQKPLKLQHKGSGNGINISSDCGLHLGSDLVICYPTLSCTPLIYTKIAEGYENRPVNNTTLAGAPTFQGSLWEIYGIQA